ncbi:hypothetical protein [Iningainema tapete]|uniref:Uncharacterized protein n=1 Tax=Iningainema tapete BLCC-T55 TaxID=2748662 RepID=A0A8J6XFV9_9CYAN|nr:hypothetical protein [Iningainema tapete]MBD2773333.1 hypothetical protein [Iningainema tapete BLCC-T55]
MTWREEFNELPPGYKLSLCASWLLAFSLCLFVLSSLIVIGNWFIRSDVPEQIKKSFVLGLGGSVGSLVFGCGAAMMGDRATQSELERLDSQRQKVEHHHCKSCKFYSSNINLHCAVNPNLVLTDEAVNCSDWQEID